MRQFDNKRAWHSHSHSHRYRCRQQNLLGEITQAVTRSISASDNVIEYKLINNQPIDVVYTWVNGSDEQLIRSLVAVRASHRANVSRSDMIAAEVNKCTLQSSVGYIYVEVPLGIVERVSDVAISLLDAKQLDAVSRPRSTLFYFRNIDHRKCVARYLMQRSLIVNMLLVSGRTCRLFIKCDARHNCTPRGAISTPLFCA